MSDGLPEIIDVVGFARDHDVVVYGFDGGVAASYSMRPKVDMRSAP